jgi:hypothetical protein
VRQKSGESEATMEKRSNNQSTRTVVGAAIRDASRRSLQKTVPKHDCTSMVRYVSSILLHITASVEG